MKTQRCEAASTTSTKWPWQQTKGPGRTTPDAETVIKGMYDAINARDVEGACEFLDDEVVYQDLNFPEFFEGKSAVRQLFFDSCTGIPDDLLFVIDECTSGDPLAVGIVWHVEIAGIPFPNGRGVSFYRLSPSSGKLVFARDIVENPLKAGDAAFTVIRLVAPLVKRLLAPSTATTGKSKEQLSAKTLGLWGLAAAYWYILLLSPPNNPVPGEPGWAIRPETLQEVIDESTNFFFILPGLNTLGINLMNAPVCHPTSEGFFNFAEAFIFMFLPLLLEDKGDRDLPTLKFWVGEMFLTNAILTPYMALRQNNREAELPEATSSTPPEDEKREKSSLARGFGITGLGVGLLSIWWYIAARPEFGGLTERNEYFAQLLTTDRVTIAFMVDILMFSGWQFVLMQSAKDWGDDVPLPKGFKFVPFWGLAAWLII